MKKQTDSAKAEPNELREHYDFDYGRAKPNRFAARLGKETTLVVLDPDVATVFQTSESVNDALRVLITAAGNTTAAKHSRRTRSAPLRLSRPLPPDARHAWRRVKPGLERSLA